MLASPPCCALRSLVLKAVLLFAAVQAQSSSESNTLGTQVGSSSTQFLFPSTSSSPSSSDLLVTTTALGTTLSSSSQPQSATITTSLSSKATMAILLSSDWITTTGTSSSILTSAILKLTTALVTSPMVTNTTTVLLQASPTMLATVPVPRTSYSSPFTTPASQIVPSSSYPISTTPTAMSLSTGAWIIISEAAGGGGGALLVLLCCVCCTCCVCCCHRMKQRRSVKLMKKQEPTTSVLFIQNYNQAIIQEVATYDDGTSMQGHKPTMPVLKSHTLHSEHPAHPILVLDYSIQAAPDVQRSSSTVNPTSLPGNSKQTPPDDRTSVPNPLPSKGKQVPPNAHPNEALLPSSTQQAAPDIRPHSSTLPDSSNNAEHECDKHITSTLPPSSQLHCMFPNSGKQVVPPHDQTHTTEQLLAESETKRLPSAIAVDKRTTASTSIEPKKPVPLPRARKPINVSGNSTEDQYVDPREFTRDRVLSIVLMENEAAVHPKSTEGEDLYVAMEHIREGSSLSERRDAPVSPMYVNMVRPHSSSFAAPSSSRELPDSNKQQEEEEEYVQMAPELQKQLRRNTDPSQSSGQGRERPAMEDGADEYVSVMHESSLLEDVFSRCRDKAKDNGQHSWPNKDVKDQSVDGEELYYNFA